MQWQHWQVRGNDVILYFTVHVILTCCASHCILPKSRAFAESIQSRQQQQQFCTMQIAQMHTVYVLHRSTQLEGKMCSGIRIVCEQSENIHFGGRVIAAAAGVVLVRGNPDVNFEGYCTVQITCTAVALCTVALCTIRNVL